MVFNSYESNLNEKTDFRKDIFAELKNTIQVKQFTKHLFAQIYPKVQDLLRDEQQYSKKP